MITGKIPTERRLKLQVSLQRTILNPRLLPSYRRALIRPLLLAKGAAPESVWWNSTTCNNRSRFIDSLSFRLRGEVSEQMPVADLLPAQDSAGETAAATPSTSPGSGRS